MQNKQAIWEEGNLLYLQIIEGQRVVNTTLTHEELGG